MMKKIILAVLAVVLLMGTLAGCGNQNTEGTDEALEESTEAAKEQAEVVKGPDEDTSGLVYLADFRAGDYVTLGEYKGVETEVELLEITDEEVDAYIAYFLSANAEAAPVTDRSVERGDVVNIDFEGKQEGVAFEGGNAQGFDITIGAGGFIDGFEEGIIGMEIGETKDLDLTFPDPYLNNPNMAGAPVVFTITVNSISQQITPELTDEFVAGLAIEDCATVEDYRKYVHNGLSEQAAADYEDNKANAVMAFIEENAEFQEAPEGITNRMKEIVENTMSSYAQIYGMTTADYVAAVYGSTADAYEDVIAEQAALMARRYIMMGAIAEEEGITITDEDLDKALAQEAEDYGYESPEEYREAVDAEAYREYLLAQEVITFLTENAVVNSPVQE